jgi:O-antigen/teichoic acid export membrane protein
MFGNLFFQGAAQASSYAVNLTIIPLVIKTTGAGTYGAFVILNSMFMLSMQLFSLGAGYRCRRRLPAMALSAEREMLFLPSASFQLLSYLLTAAIMASLVPWIDAWFFKGNHPLSIWLVPFVVLSNYLLNLAEDYFRNTQRVKLMSVVFIIRSFLQPAIVVIISLWRHVVSVDSLFIAQTLAIALPALFLWRMMAREIHLRFKLDPWEQYRWDIRHGFPLMSAVLVENLLAVCDRYILAGYLSMQHVGAYAAACAIGSLILFVPKMVTYVMLPALSHAIDIGQRREAQALLNRALQFYLFLCVPFLAGAALLAKPLLTLLGNAEVAALGHWVVPLVAAGCGIYGYTFLVFNSLFVQMDTRVWLRANLAAAATSILFNFILISIFRRIEAAAVAMVISYTVSALIIERFRDRAWHIHFDFGILTKILAATAGMTLAVWLLGRLPSLQASPLLAVGVQASTGVLFYIGALWWLRALPLDALQRALWRPTRRL